MAQYQPSLAAQRRAKAARRSSCRLGTKAGRLQFVLRATAGKPPSLRQCKAARAVCPSSRTTAFREANVPCWATDLQGLGSPPGASPSTETNLRVRSAELRIVSERSFRGPDSACNSICSQGVRDLHVSLRRRRFVVRVHVRAPNGDHDVTAASRPVKAFVPVRLQFAKRTSYLGN